MAVTMADIAEMLGTTHATVSRALSGDSKISAKMRRRVLAAVEQTGYRPSALARGLRGGRTQTIGILWLLPGLHSPTAVVRTMAAALMQKGYLPYVASTSANMEILERTLEDFALRHVDGVIVQWRQSTPPTEKIVSLLKSFPAAVVVHSGQDDIRFDCVDQIIRDHARPFRAVADHFARTGRQRLAALIAHPRELKVRAFAEGARSCGLEISPEHIYDVKLGSEGVIYEAFQTTLKDVFPDCKPTFDAVVCSCDEAAAGVMQLLQHWGIGVPEDVAVVGYNDSELSRFCVPALASMARKDEELTDLAVDMLLRRLEDETLPRQSGEVVMEFVWRESAGGRPVEPSRVAMHEESSVKT